MPGSKGPVSDGSTDFLWTLGGNVRIEIGTQAAVLLFNLRKYHCKLGKKDVGCRVLMIPPFGLPSRCNSAERNDLPFRSLSWANMPERLTSDFFHISYVYKTTRVVGWHHPAWHHPGCWFPFLGILFWKAARWAGLVVLKHRDASHSPRCATRLMRTSVEKKHKGEILVIHGWIILLFRMVITWEHVFLQIAYFHTTPYSRSSPGNLGGPLDLLKKLDLLRWMNWPLCVLSKLFQSAKTQTRASGLSLLSHWVLPK